MAHVKYLEYSFPKDVRSSGVNNSEFVLSMQYLKISSRALVISARICVRET
jgi:hypothetical protein